MTLSLSNPAVIRFAKKNGCSLEEAREELMKTPSPYEAGTAVSPYFAFNPDVIVGVGVDVWEK